MRDPARILIADDNAANVDILRTRLESHGYEVITAADGEEALAKIAASVPDLVLLDVMMPRLDGLEVCRRVKAHSGLPFMPVVIVTARSESRDVIAGLDAGADEYLTKPVDHGALVARVRSMLRIKSLQDTVEAQRAQIERWNSELEARVQDQVAQLDRLGRLKGFFPPQLADMIVSGGADALLAPHRREVTLVFLDLRGFTSLNERAEPEEVLHLLDQYHAVVGQEVTRHQAMIEHFAGDGVMILLNDPIVIPDPSDAAVQMTLAIQEKFAAVRSQWNKQGYELDLGAGIARGFATLGTIGFEGRRDYAVIGNAANLAARLCAEAKAGQILTDRKTLALVEDRVRVEPVGELSLKGFARPVEAYNIIGYVPAPVA